MVTRNIRLDGLDSGMLVDLRRVMVMLRVYKVLIKTGAGSAS